MVRPQRLTKTEIAAYVAEGFWKPVTMAQQLERFAASWPEREAVVDAASRWTWAEALEFVEQ